MMAEHQDTDVTDEQVRDFKLEAARILTPHASAVLIDRQFALEEAIAQGVVAPGCGLIAAADHFEPAYGEVVGTVNIDRALDPAALRASGAVAMKLLVLYRPDGGAAERIAMTEEFIDLCRNAGLVSIIEPVSRKALDGASGTGTRESWQQRRSSDASGPTCTRPRSPTAGRPRRTRCARTAGS